MELIPRARLTTQFLESNASTHESVFGAIAEIVDNAYDSGSAKLEIDVAHPDDNSIQGGYYLILRDYGCGMVADEIYNVIAYGWSNKSDKPNMIGMYGNGLKSGSMRVANDCLVLSKKNNECSALMISQTFIKTPSSKFENPDNEVICPLPSWRIETDSSTGETKKNPIYNEKNNIEKEKRKHAMEIELILRYSPFAKEEDLLAEFDSLEEHGTAIYMYQLNLNENGEPELSIDYDETGSDIFDVGDHDKDIKSLRKYLSRLYLKPKMEIYLRQDLIKPTRVQDLMYERRKYSLPQKKFRSIAKTKIADLKSQKKKLELKIQKVRGQIAAISKESENESLAENNKKIRLLNLTIEEYTTNMKRIDDEISAKQSTTSEKDFMLYLGYHIRNRSEAGLRIFHKNRLIVEIEGHSWASWPLGVMACVDVPAALMQPSMSKQRFSDEREYRTLKTLCFERAADYARRVRMEFEKWESFGYPNSDPTIERNENDKSTKHVENSLPKLYRCTECGKFRQVTTDKQTIDAEFFICMENQDKNFNKCSIEEENITTKQLELMPVIKREKDDFEVEECAVSPEKKKHKRDESNGMAGKRLVHDAPVKNSRRRISEDESSGEEIIINRRKMPARKRKSGGAEVTSGFDRHRVISSDEQSSEEVDSPKTSKIIEDKVAQMKESNEENLRMQMRLDEAEKRMEKAEKMAQSEREKTAKLTTEMKSCIKNFYPTSWKDKAEYGHKNIDSWDYSKIRNVMSNWKETYGQDLKKVVDSTKQKKALKARIETCLSLQKCFKENPQKIGAKIDKEIKEAKLELAKIEKKK